MTAAARVDSKSGNGSGCKSFSFEKKTYLIGTKK